MSTYTGRHAERSGSISRADVMVLVEFTTLAKCFDFVALRSA